MAMFRAVDPLASYAKDRQPMWKDDGGAMAVDRVGENAWVMVHAGDVREKSSVSTVSFCVSGGSVDKVSGLPST